MNITIIEDMKELSNKELAKTLSIILILFGLITIITAPIHELGHGIICELLGAEWYFDFSNMPIAAYVHFYGTFSLIQKQIIFIFGGLFCGSILAIVAFIFKKLKINKLIVASLILSSLTQFIYSIIEVTIIL